MAEMGAVNLILPYTDLSKHCLLTYGNKIVPVAGADICVWQPHALGEGDSLVPFLFAE